MFDKIIRENHFKTLCVIAIYIFIFIVIGLLVDIIRINATSLSFGFYELLTFREFPLVMLCMLGLSCGIVLYCVGNFDRLRKRWGILFFIWDNFERDRARRPCWTMTALSTALLCGDSS